MVEQSSLTMARSEILIFSSRTDGWVSSDHNEFKNHIGEIRDVAMSQNLALLAGLGTSLGLAGRKSAAPSMGELWRVIEARIGAEEFARIVKQIGFIADEGRKDVEALLSRCNLAFRYTNDKPIGSFIQTAETVIRELIDFVDSTTDLASHELLLRKLARRSARLPRFRIFTTNYDLCFEVAARKLRFVVVDGFSISNPRVFDPSNFDVDFVRRISEREALHYISGVFHLYKLHGSLDWEQSSSDTLQVNAASQPLIIYPRDSKFESSYEQPYLEMMSRFQTFVRQPATGIIVCGFGFNDRHITQPLMQAVASNVGLRLLVVDPNVEDSTNECFARLRNLVSSGDARITLLKGTFSDLAKLIPDLSLVSEGEDHEERISRLNKGNSYEHARVSPSV